MGLTGFNKRRREAALLAAQQKAEAQSTVSPQPVKKTEDNPAPTETPKPTHKVGKKATDVEDGKDK